MIVGGLLALTAMLFEGYVLYNSSRPVPILMRSATPAAGVTQAASTPTPAITGSGGPGPRSLPPLVASTQRPVIAGGVIAGPATQGAFVSGAATARPITGPSEIRHPVAIPGPTGTAEASRGPTTGASTPAPVGTFLNPVPLGTGFSLPGLGTFTVHSMSWQPGQIGLAVVVISLTCDQPAASGSCDSSSLLLAAVGNSGNSYGRDFDPAIPGPVFAGLTHLYGGDTDRGNAGFSITSVESTLRLSVQVFLQNGEFYFQLLQTAPAGGTQR